MSSRCWFLLAERVFTIVWMFFGVGFYAFTVFQLAMLISKLDTRYIIHLYPPLLILIGRPSYRASLHRSMNSAKNRTYPTTSSRNCKQLFSIISTVTSLGPRRRIFSWRRCQLKSSGSWLIRCSRTSRPNSHSSRTRIGSSLQMSCLCFNRCRSLSGSLFIKRGSTLIKVHQTLPLWSH